MTDLAVPDLAAFGLRGIPLIAAGTDLGRVICDAARRSHVAIEHGDVVVIAQKVVSKAEGAVVALRDVVVTPEAEQLARQTGRDSRLCQVYLNESARVLRVRGRMVITLHRLGFECSSAGVDRSNVGETVEERVSLLPKDPDTSARLMRDRIRAETGATVAVIVSDSFGRRDRDGSIGVAIGIAGIRHLEERPQNDLYGMRMTAKIALVDELAATASVVMGQGDEALPVVVIRGARYSVDENAQIRLLLGDPDA